MSKPHLSIFGVGRAKVVRFIRPINSMGANMCMDFRDSSVHLRMPYGIKVFFSFHGCATREETGYRTKHAGSGNGQKQATTDEQDQFKMLKQ